MGGNKVPYGVVLSLEPLEPRLLLASTLNFSGIGELTLDFDASTIVDAGGGAPVAFAAIDEIVIDANGQDLTVALTSTDDSLTVTPLGANSARVTLDGLYPVLTFAEVGTFTVDSRGGVDTLTVVGSASDDEITVSATAVDMVSPDRQAVVHQNVEMISILGMDGDDVLTVDGSGGLAPHIDYTGGDGFDSLVLAGTPDLLSVAYDIGPGLSEGAVTQTTADGHMTVRYSEIEPVLDLVVSATLTVNGTNADNAISYEQGSLATYGRVSVDAFEYIEFANKTNLVINALGGSDTISLNNALTPTSLTTITVNGGDPTASDVVIYNGTSGVDTITVSPTGPDAATVQHSGHPGVAVTGIEHLIVDGQGGNDSLRFGLTTGSDSIVYRPGDAVDAGDFLINAFPISFQNLGASGMVSLMDTGGNDSFTCYGTEYGDLFSLNLGYLGLVNDVGLHVLVGNVFNGSTIESLKLVSLGGSDTFSLNSGSYNFVTLYGGDPDTGSDVFEFQTNTTTLFRFEDNSVNDGSTFFDFHDVELVTVNTGGGDLDVHGTPTDDIMSFTPLGANSGRVQLEGVYPTLEFTNVYSEGFEIDLLGSGSLDTLVVYGTAGDDEVEIDSGEVVPVTPSRLGVTFSNTEALVYYGLAGDDTVTVTPSDVHSVLVDGGDPISQVLDTGDWLNIITDGQTVYFGQGPHKDEGQFLVEGEMPVSFDNIEGLAQNDELYVPPAPSTPDMLAYSDGGTSDTDNITGINAPAFQGTGVPGSIVRVLADGDVVGEGIVRSELSDGVDDNGLGIWEVTVEPLADGTYDITALIEILMGNISEESSALSVTIDTVLPQIPTIDLIDADDTGISSTDNITIGQGLGVADFRISAETDSTVYIKDGNVIIDTFVFDNAFDLTDGVADGFGLRTIDFLTNETTYSIPGKGPHPLTVESIEPASNVRQSEQLLVTITSTDLALVDFHQYADGVVVSIYDVDPTNGISDPTISWTPNWVQPCADITVNAAPEHGVQWIVLNDGAGSLRDIAIVIENNTWFGRLVDLRSDASEDLAAIASQGQIHLINLRSGIAGGQLNGLISEGGWQLPTDIDNDGATDDLTGVYSEQTLVTTYARGEIAGDVVSRFGRIARVVSVLDPTGISGDVYALGDIFKIVAVGGGISGNVTTECTLYYIAATAGDISGTLTAGRGMYNVRSIGGGLIGPSINAGPIGVRLLVAVGGDITTTVNSEGPITALYTTGNLTGDINAVNMFASARVLGSVIGSNITVSGSTLGKFVVMNDMVDSYIRLEDGGGLVDGTLGRVIVLGNMTDSSIDSGTIGLVYVGGLITEAGGDDYIHATSGFFYIRDTSLAGYVYTGNDLWFDEGQPTGQRAFIA